MTRRILSLRALAATGLLTLGLGAVSSGCLNRPIDRLEPRTTSTVVERLTQSAVDKIDLLLAIDNSISMADKQAILAEAVPDLVERLVKPICVNIDTGDPADPPQSVDAMGECPTGLKPEFPPIKNINVGIISSSLGALTAANCMDIPKGQDDKAHLLSRMVAGGNATTYQGKGFLAWDPESQREPPGTTSSDELVATLGEMVVGVNQTGCGYEMQLESVYRFLADPDPYESLSPGADGRLVENGTDQVLLTQRADFLRANSLLAVLILSDENDCSVDVSGQGFLVLGQTPFYQATEECANNPEDPCCTSCALGNPDGCAADANCGAQGTTGANKYAASDDHGNLRCFEQKRRYGVDFLYPVQRYVNAFTLVNIDPSRRDLSVSDPKKAVKNPIFQDLSGQGLAVRDPGLVFVAGIVGIPWQYLARGCKPGGDPCPGAPPDLQYGFKSFNELAEEKSASGSALLDALIGDPDKHVIPEDPFMRESIAKRSGNSVVAGLEGQSLPGANSLNGNDRDVTVSDDLNGDLQYSCIFALDTPVPDGTDCTKCGAAGASCDEPLCDPANKSTQINAKAYPGLRELALLKGLGNQGIFASICPQQTDTPTAGNYGYRPAVGAIIDRLKQELGGQCLPRKLNVNPNTGQVPCLVLEATVTDSCNCDPAMGRKEVDAENQNAVKAAQSDEFAPEGGWNCFCEIVQFACPQDSEGKCINDPNSEQYICQNVEAVPTEINGWCYVDATPPGPVGNPDLVADCAEDEKRLVRFVNKGLPQPGATVFVTCTGDSVE